MGSETESRIPAIDFTKENLKPGTESCFSTREKVRNAFEEYGCFVAAYDKVYSELHNSVFAAAEDLFALPTETEKRKTTDHVGFGYAGQSSVIALYESLGIDNPTSLEQAQNFTNIMWPEGDDKFRESVDSFAKAVEELHRMATRMVFESYGLERLYESHMEATFYHFRFSKYRTRQRNETELGLYNHTDKDFISILHQNQVKGLQIKTKGGFWIDADLSSPSSFLVIAGDILMAWSNNDRVWASEHQVIIEEQKDTRYTTVFSSFIKGVIKVPEELVDENFPLRYKPIDHFDFFRFYFTQSRRGTKFSSPAIKVYCGV